MPTSNTIVASMTRAHFAKQSLAHLKMDDDDPRVWAGPGARVWVNDHNNDPVLNIALGPNPRREAIAQLHAFGYVIVEVVTPTLFVIEKRRNGCTATASHQRHSEHAWANGAWK